MDNKRLIETCSEKLKAIACEVLAEDRKAAMRDLNISYPTVVRYLKGEVKDLDLGIRMYTLFNTRMQQRNEVLA